LNKGMKIICCKKIAKRQNSHALTHRIIMGIWYTHARGPTQKELGRVREDIMNFLCYITSFYKDGQVFQFHRFHPKRQSVIRI